MRQGETGAEAEAEARVHWSDGGMLKQQWRAASAAGRTAVGGPG